MLSCKTIEKPHKVSPSENVPNNTQKNTKNHVDVIVTDLSAALSSPILPHPKALLNSGLVTGMTIEVC